MNDKHRTVLRRQWSRLRRDLEPKKLLPYLVTILDETDEQEVKSKGTREEQTDKLLEIIPRRGPQAFACFLDALENVQPFLASPLKEEAEMEEKMAEMKTELGRARTHSARLREDMRSMSVFLESERNRHENTKKELEELKSLHQSLLKQFKNENFNMLFAMSELKNARKKEMEELSFEKRKRADLEREFKMLKSERDQVVKNLEERKREIAEPQERFTNSTGENDKFCEGLENQTSVFDLGNKNKVRRQLSLDETQRNVKHEYGEMPRRRALTEKSGESGRERSGSQTEKNLLDCKEVVDSEDLRDLLETVMNERDIARNKCQELERKLMNLQLQEQNKQVDRATPVKNGTQNEEVEELDVCENCKLLEDQCEALETEKDQRQCTSQALRENIRQLECREKELTGKFEREKSTLESRVKSMEEHCERTATDHANEIRNLKIGMTEQHLLEMKDLQNQKAELTSHIERDKHDVLRLKAELEKERESAKGQHRDHEKLKKKLQSEKKQLKQKLEQESKLKKESKKETDRALLELEEEEKRNNGEIARLKTSVSDQQDKCEMLRTELEQWKTLSGRVFNYKKDFDRNGVIYGLGTNFGTCTWMNPSTNSSPVQVAVTQSSNDHGYSTDLLENRKGTLSCTRDEERSWWCVDLGEDYVLFPTQYTLRHGRDNGLSVIRNWRLEGSRNGNHWMELKVHENDRGMKGTYPFYTGTWSIDGQVKAMRYFRIYQTGKNSSGRYALYLSGFEMYGILVDMQG